MSAKRRDSSQGETGTRDITYDLISVTYHLLQGAETINRYIGDAEREDDQELAQFFRETKEEYTRRADRAKQLLVRYAGRRQGLRVLLTTESDFNVIGEADDGREAQELVKRLSPDVLVLDLMMPGLNGLEVARQLNKQASKVGVVVLSMHDDEGFVLEALANGVSAYVLKDSNSSDLVQAVREVAAGRRYLSPPLSDRAIGTYQQMAKIGTMDSHETLTTREREVLQLSAEGHTNSEISARLGISTRTAETHRSHLMHKLALHTQSDLIRYALRRRVIPLENARKQ